MSTLNQPPSCFAPEKLASKVQALYLSKIVVVVDRLLDSPSLLDQEQGKDLKFFCLKSSMAR